MNIQMVDVLKEATASLEAAFSGLKWEKVDEAGLVHYTGRGPEWRVELVVLVTKGKDPEDKHNSTIRFERMATGVRGSLILKLTEDQARQAEVLARNQSLCELCGAVLRHRRHTDTTADDFCPFLGRR